MVVKWTFLDTDTSETHTFEINPTIPASPEYTKTIKHAASIGPNDQVIISEGDAVQELNFSGTILTESEYNVFVTWWEKEVPVTVTDDLARSFTVFIRDFMPKRERSLDYPWRHSYEVKAIILAGVDGPTSNIVADFSATIGARS